jgi:hypothetical protein
MTSFLGLRFRFSTGRSEMRRYVCTCNIRALETALIAVSDKIRYCSRHRS